MTWPEGSAFARQVAHRRVDCVRLEEARRHKLPGDTDLLRRVPQRPAMFAVQIPDLWEDPAVAPLLEACQSTRGAVYIGRIVEGRHPDGFLAELWEVPSGRSMAAVLPGTAWARDRRRTPLEPGEHVRVWTWEDKGTPRVVFTARRRTLTRDERRVLRTLVQGARLDAARDP